MAELEGWRPSPPGFVVRPTRLERHRARQLERLAVSRPVLHARLRSVQAGWRRAVDAVVPARRVGLLAGLSVGLTAFDALATLVVVGTGLAVEANPLLAALVERVGLLPTMLLRLGVGGGLVWALAWLSSWRHEVRPTLLLVAGVLGSVAVWHVVGTIGAVLADS